VEVGQEGSLREGLEAAIRERVREIIEMVLQEKWKQRWVRGAASGWRSGRLPAWIEATEADPAHGHGSAGRAAGALAEADGSEREWQSQLVPRYRRSSREVEQSVLGVYLSGSNTRRIRGRWSRC